MPAAVLHDSGSAALIHHGAAHDDALAAVNDKVGGFAVGRNGGAGAGFQNSADKQALGLDLDNALVMDHDTRGRAFFPDEGGASDVAADCISLFLVSDDRVDRGTPAADEHLVSFFQCGAVQGGKLPGATM